MAWPKSGKIYYVCTVVVWYTTDFVIHVGECAPLHKGNVSFICAPVSAFSIHIRFVRCRATCSLNPITNATSSYHFWLTNSRSLVLIERNGVADAIGIDAHNLFYCTIECSHMGDKLLFHSSSSSHKSIGFFLVLCLFIFSIGLFRSKTGKRHLFALPPALCAKTECDTRIWNVVNLLWNTT